MAPPVPRIAHDYQFPRLVEQTRLLQPQSPVSLMRIQFIVASPHEPCLIAYVEVLKHKRPSREEAAGSQRAENPHIFSRGKICSS
jgi:hypothetical protein